MVVRRQFENSKEVDVEELIDRGAAVKGESSPKDKKWVIINLRIPVDMLNEIDGIIARSVGFTRTGWLLQSIQKKLKQIKLGEEDL